MRQKRLFFLLVILLSFGCASTRLYEDAVYNKSNVWLDIDRLVSRDFATYQDLLREPLLKVWKQRAVDKKVSAGLFADPDKIVQALLPKDGKPVGGEKDCEKTLGVILLLHGLYDSPYTMKDLGEVFNKQCFATRYLLLPGHGTQTGDLRYTKMEDWVRTVRFAVKTVKKDYHGQDIYLAGFSTGGALAIHQAMEDDSIKALFLFAPLLDRKMFALEGAALVEACCEFVEKNAEVDSMKYESTTANSVIQAGRLVEKLQHGFDNGYALKIPVFVALAKNDYTVPAGKTIKLFLNGNLGDDNYIVIYSPSSVEQVAPMSCSDTKYVNITKGKLTVCNSRFFYKDKVYINDFSHMALTLKPDNEHYGLNGNYKYCSHYRSDEDRDECFLPDKKRLCYGERKLRGGQHSDFCKEEQTVIRRLTANPLFPHLEQQLASFIGTL